MIVENIKFNRVKHITQKQIADLTGLSFDALSVRAKTDPNFPELLFISNGSELVYDKQDALWWITFLETTEQEKKNIAPPREIKHISQHGEYKPSFAMKIALERTAEVYPHTFITPKGIGNYHHNMDYGIE